VGAAGQCRRDSIARFYLGSDLFHEFAMQQIEEQRRIVDELGLREE
jgi:hypothetical protein